MCDNEKLSFDDLHSLNNSGLFIAYNISYVIETIDDLCECKTNKQ